MMKTCCDEMQRHVDAEVFETYPANHFSLPRSTTEKAKVGQRCLVLHHSDGESVVYYCPFCGVSTVWVNVDA